MRHPLSTLLVCMLVVAVAATTGWAQGSAPLRPGDGVRITVFEDAEAFSGEFVIDDRGMLVLPRLGDWPATGMPADSVRPRLVAALRTSLTSAGISVIPFRRVVVAGAVLRPGLYAVDAAMTVSDALILAGGPRDDAQPRVERRNADGSVQAVSPAANVWTLALGSAEQLIVPRAGWLRRYGWQMSTVVLQIALLVVQVTQ